MEERLHCFFFGVLRGTYLRLPPPCFLLVAHGNTLVLTTTSRQPCSRHQLLKHTRDSRHDTLDSGALGLEHSRGSTWALRRIHALYGSQLTVKSLKLFQSVAAVYAAILVSDEYPRSKTGRHAMVTKKYVDIGVPVAFAWLKASGVPLPPELTEDRMMCTTFGPKCELEYHCLVTGQRVPIASPRSGGRVVAGVFGNFSSLLKVFCIRGAC